MTIREKIESWVTAGTVTRGQADRALRVLASQPITHPDAAEFVSTQINADGDREIVFRPQSQTIVVNMDASAAERLTIRPAE